MVEFLVPQEKYLESGAHIGTRQKHGSMKPFIYKAREDGLHVLDLKKLDERLRVSAQLIARYPLPDVYIVGNKDNARKPIEALCELLGCTPLTGRFTPGRFTNPAREDFCEPKLVVVTDPSVDRQAVKEAFAINVPIIAFCDTNNSTNFLDVIVPTNNKGRKSVALMYALLTREVMKATGAIPSDDAFADYFAKFES